jgi:hypothetical protein
LNIKRICSREGNNDFIVVRFIAHVTNPILVAVEDSGGGVRILLTSLTGPILHTTLLESVVELRMGRNQEGKNDPPRVTAISCATEINKFLCTVKFEVGVISSEGWVQIKCQGRGEEGRQEKSDEQHSKVVVHTTTFR